MFLWVTAPFVKTPAHAPPPAKWEVTYARVEQMTRDGAYCAWEAESLIYDGKPLWTAEPPEDESFCKAPFEAARTVDVIGQDGPFLSVRLTEWGCCPEEERRTRCLTYDLRTGEPATVESYDPRHAGWRRKKLARVLQRRDGGGWTVEPGAFVVGDGHLRVCAARGDEDIEVRIR